MLVISISVVVLINEVYTMIRPMDARGLEKFNNLPDKFDIVNVGSSHGQLSFNYSSIDGIMDCANLFVSFLKNDACSFTQTLLDSLTFFVLKL